MSLFDESNPTAGWPWLSVDGESRWVTPPSTVPGFCDRVLRTLRRMAPNPVYSMVSTSLHYEPTAITHFKNVIVDFPDAVDEDLGRVPAMTVPWNVEDATRRGEPQRRADDPTTLEDETGWPIFGAPVGTGLGSPAVIYFDPQSTARGYLIAREDGVLMHELGHAVRIVRGAETRRPVGPAPRLGDAPRLPWLGFPNREEFFAQVVMNMYLLAAGRAGIAGYRPNRWAPAALPPPRMYDLRSGRVRGAPRRASLAAWMREMRAFEQRQVRDIIRLGGSIDILIRNLAGIPRDQAPYNPFRDVNDQTARVLVPRAYL